MKERAITRFRTEYDPIEDRIKLVAELEDDHSDTVVIMLTRRLLIRLVPNVSKALDAPKYSTSNDPVSLHQFAQSAASDVISTKTETPVVASEVTPVVLPVTVELAPSTKALKILFGGNDVNNGDIKYALPMPALHLRQWLAILYRLFGTAGWPAQVFPSWIADTGRAGASQSSAAIH